MKLITSPAKLMKISSENKFGKTTRPQFIEDSNFLMSNLREKNPKFLQELMEISPKIADENWQRNQVWEARPNANESCAALFAFTGEVYRGIHAESLSDGALNYLKKNYRILSGLYGLLKPSDRIMLYRLEMGRNFSTDVSSNLYDFWTEKITSELNAQTKPNELILNLASKEYFKVINRKKLHAKVIDFDFYEMSSGKAKTIVVYTKHARGLVVRFCAENNARNFNDVKAFNLEGYFLDEEKSTDSHLIFLR